MATEGNLMAEDFVSKLDHHLRAIVKAAEGDLHWPEKYRQHFKVCLITCTPCPHELLGWVPPSWLCQ
jgi:hypothetical protein